VVVGGIVQGDQGLAGAGHRQHLRVAEVSQFHWAACP